ncbi:MAG: CoA transferase, partial [Immundisolibacteraceae bacterium]|nr:CoA transferase [Immundisolibacteraceae bacterium]
MDREAFYANADPKSLGPLQGIRVLEATNYASGPVCGMILSDFGADSIKCEMPGKGDPNRGVPPFYSDAGDTESSVVFAGINRGKRGVTLDFRQPEGQALFRKLAAQADIIVENFTPGTMKKWGIGYEEICAVKPDIIYISISGFGQFGPLHHKKGFDPVGQAMG